MTWKFISSLRLSALRQYHVFEGHLQSWQLLVAFWSVLLWFLTISDGPRPHGLLFVASRL